MWEQSGAGCSHIEVLGRFRGGRDDRPVEEIILAADHPCSSVIIMRHVSTDELQAGLGEIMQAPADAGLIEMLVLRPEVDERTTVQAVRLVEGTGAQGDNYMARGNPNTEDGAAHPEAQITIMNSRVLGLITGGDREHWRWAGDQILVDMDLSADNLPPGTRLQMGSAVLEVSAKPHTGCAKFARRFGLDAAKWINSDPNLRLRGLNAMVVTTGSCAVGDLIMKA